MSPPAQVPSADLAVVVVAGAEAPARATLRGLAEQELGDLRTEVLLVRLWPADWGRGDGEERSPARVVDVAGAGAAVAANAGLAAATAPLVLVLAAGDVPARADLLARHAEAHEAGGPLAVLGEVAGETSPGGGGSAMADWVGLRPAVVPPATRHVSFPLSAVNGAGGLDERLRDLDVAVLELLSRLSAAGVGIAQRPDLVVRATAPDDLDSGLAVAAHAGRSAQALDALLAERGTPTVTVGPARARPLLRWCSRPLVRAARLGLADQPRLERLARRAAFARGRGRLPLILAAAGRGGVPQLPGEERPPVAIVVPFAGDADEGERLLDALEAVRTGEDDELVVVDNSPTATVRERPSVRVVHAAEEPSSYYARNAGALATRAPWLLFLDGDCRPAPWILDAFFAPAPGANAGAVAGGILSQDRGSLVERYSSATLLSPALALAHPDRPYAVTANLLVSRSAWERLGGFAEGVRSGGDVDFCWRLQEDGQELEYRPHAAVVHQHRSTLAGLLRQYRRYGSGAGWLSRRYPGARGPRVRWVELRGGLVDIAAARFELAGSRLLTFACGIAALVGRLGSNRPAATPVREGGWQAVALAQRFPDADDADALEETAALAADGALAVEARHRPRRAVRDHRADEVSFGEDDAPVDLLAAVLALARRPGGPGRLLRATRDRAALAAFAMDAAAAVRLSRRGPQRLVLLGDDPAETVAAARLADLANELGLAATLSHHE